MIPLSSPEDLPLILRGIRRATGRTLGDASVEVAVAVKRDAHSVKKQISAWENGHKVPLLSSLGPYLNAHRAALAVTLDERSSWCSARRSDPFRTRCALMVGHAGAHCTYAGDDFR